MGMALLTFWLLESYVKNRINVNFGTEVDFHVNIDVMSIEKPSRMEEA